MAEPPPSAPEELSSATTKSFSPVPGWKPADEMIAAVRKEIADETDRETGRSKQISTVPIYLSLYSPNDNITCSVASCGITSNDSFKLRCNFSRGPVEDTEGNCSDAESVCHRGFKEGNCFLPRQVELAEEIHRLELHAYRCTIEALHALGPLSWEQETLVTNLRLSLHISNDEHLMELRNLVSTATSKPLS